ncbi:hypothetical protein LTR36_006479 [Oleoguttula mirabilis]|uniref:Smr domain-containing protein n=1 Tax=Oleoguttula mirabilis TaxID=1507867 RepID=A0AAV9JUT9_9PEZI|nr:hypothetical protein LTR36_006479 [Oleoguttula mirabilis]
MDDAFAQLEAEYCPPIDPALLSAIVSDYDLSNPENIQDARSILDQLKESALLEEAAGFDPSGTGAQGDVTSSDKRAESCPETNASPTGSTDLTSLSNGLSSLDLEDIIGDDNENVGSAEDLENLDEDTKVRLLQDVFGDRVSKYSIQHTLKKCNGRWQAAMEELLNHVYFDEAEHSDDSGKIAAKGIDAFSEDNVVRRGRKGKAKGKRVKTVDVRRASSLPLSDDGSASAPAPNKWQTAAEDIEFVASRTRIGTATVSSLYYAEGASTARTIGALLKLSMEESKLVVTDDAAVATHARELGYDFPGVAPGYLAALIRLTHPSTSAAHELAEALTTKPKHGSNGGIQIIPHYVAPIITDLDFWQSASRKSRSLNAAQSPVSDGSAVTARATAYASARATAFSQASAAHRRARSDRLMGGVAGYYSQVGREFHALSSNASAAAADQLAAAQSTSGQVDLHGIDVLNAVRIAQEKVEEWWYGLGESRVNGRLGAEDRQTGYRIIVGLGRHSEGGRSKLGPAVSKTLRQRGWRIEPAGAVIVVRGKAKA